MYVYHSLHLINTPTGSPCCNGFIVHLKKLVVARIIQIVCFISFFQQQSNITLIPLNGLGAGCTLGSDCTTGQVCDCTKGQFCDASSKKCVDCEQGTKPDGKQEKCIPSIFYNFFFNNHQR